MAKSLCIASLLMIFLLISTGLPKGKAQCERVEVSNGIPPGTCRQGLIGRTICNSACTVRGNLRGECDTLQVCNCYRCPAP
ncbi:hypothetical protein Bca4012_021787 [Brassica carinata]